MATFTDGTTAGVVTRDMIAGQGAKQIITRVPATFVWGTDLIVVDLKVYGGHYLAGFLAFEETTAGSVVIAATGTTAVSTGTMTYTSTGSSANTVGGSLIMWIY